MKQDSMLLISSTWGQNNSPTFKLIPLYENVPYQEVIFDPGSKILAVISKIPMKKFTMVPKLDATGNRIMEFDKKDKNKPVGFKQERIQIDSFQEYYIEAPEEIMDFINRFAVNITENNGGKLTWFERIQEFLIKTEAPPGEITISKPMDAQQMEDAINTEKVNQ